MIRYVVPYVLYSIAALVCIFLQSIVFVHLKIFNVVPDLLLIVVVLSALKSDWKNGVAVGLLLGFWIDLMNAAYFGTNMVAYSMVGAVFGLVGTKFPHRTYEGYFFSVLAGSFMSGFLMLMLLSLLGAIVPSGQTIGGIILPMAFYTALMMFLGLPLIWFHRSNNRRKIGRIDLIGNGVIFVKGNEVIDLKRLAARREAYRRKKSPRQKHDKKRAAEQAEARRKSGNRNRKVRNHASGHDSSASGTYRNRRKPVNRNPRSNPQRRSQKQKSRRSE